MEPLAVICCVGCRTYYSAQPFRPDRTGICTGCAPRAMQEIPAADLQRLFGQRGVHWDVPRDWRPLLLLVLFLPLAYWFLFLVFKTGPAPQ